MAVGAKGRFSEDYVIVMLQGSLRPSRTEALRALARRAAWLSNKIEEYGGRARDPKASFLMEELGSIAIAVEAIEAAKKADEHMDEPAYHCTCLRSGQAFGAEYHTAACARRSVESKGKRAP